MHWIRNYTGVLKSATDIRGNLYTDWRGKYIGHRGLIGLFQSDRVQDKYLIYFFPQEPAGTYLHTCFYVLQKCSYCCYSEHYRTN